MSEGMAERGPLTAHIPNEAEAVHANGLTNPRWPLCLEAEARQRGHSVEDIADGEIADPDDFELSEAGFWVVTCSECKELIHA